MKTLVWVEHDGKTVKDATLAVVTAAAKLGEVDLLVAGSGVDAVAAEAAKIAGVSNVLTADNAALEHPLAETVAPLVVKLMADHDAFLAPATSNGKNIAPRVAALLDVMQISDILGQLVLEVSAVGDMDLADAGDLGSGSGNAVDALSGDEQMDFAELRGGGYGCEGRVLDSAVGMFDQYKRLHATTPSVLSLATSSSTEPTLSPAWRLAGSVTLRTSRRGLVSTPKSPGALVASGFDLAFMMLGSEA